LDPALQSRNIQILEEVGGWTNVLARFAADHISDLERFPERKMVLLIDLDGRPDRLIHAKESIPQHLFERVFVLGVLTEPEDLKAKIGGYEVIGKALAQDCREGTDLIWSHLLLKHNETEIARMRASIREILFPGV
jgi:hypothetical protein